MNTPIKETDMASFITSWYEECYKWNQKETQHLFSQENLMASQWEQAQTASYTMAVIQKWHPTEDAAVNVNC